MKKMTIKLYSVVLIGLLLIAPITTAKNNKEVSLAEASQAIRLETKGKIISARTMNSNGHSTHKIQVLTPSGRVKTFRVPVNQSNQKNHNSRNNSSHQRPDSYNRNYQQKQSNINRSQLRDRPMHNSRLNTPRQNIIPRSRTQVNNPPATRGTSDNK